MAPPRPMRGMAPPRRGFGGPARRPPLRAVLAGVAIAAFLGVLVWVKVDGLRQQPSAATTSPLRARIVSLAQGQVGYHTTPSDTLCNTFSAYWGSGQADCGPGNFDEEWCADFAAWAWKQAGAQVVYGNADGDVNGAAVSFYRWGVVHGTWHAAGSGYTPQPGDVAVYGLNRAGTVAQHVAIVTGYQPGARGPDVINGNGSRTGDSVVEAGQDQYQADVHGTGGALAGYTSPS